MTRLFAMLLFLTPSAIWAQAKPEGDSSAATSNAESSSSATSSAESAFDSRVEREQLRRQIMDDVRKSLDKQKEEIRYELRAQAAAQAASRELEEEFVEDRKKLELFELQGYFRVRPELFYNLDLRRGADPKGYSLFFRPQGDRKTLADVNMRWRLEPTLNVSENVRIHAQLDILDNLIFGSTPDGGFGISQRTPLVVLSKGQIAPTADRNWVNDSLMVRRVYGDVSTFFGKFLFGRMGSQWGLGMLVNAGNGIDDDYGDSVDRLAFVAKVSDYYVTPMLTFTAIGPTSIEPTDPQGQPFDLDQLDDAIDYGISIAKQDTDRDIRRKLETSPSVINYGLYFTYRSQNNDNPQYYQSDNPYIVERSELETVTRNASLSIPDIWVKYQTKKMRLELEAAAILGSMVLQTPGDDQKVDIYQFGAVAQGEYNVLNDLKLNLELGFASGDRAAGMGNLPGRNGATVPGSIDGPQYCLTAECRKLDKSIRNFRFNRAYQVDLILWKEIFDGVTDAIYIRPGIKYEISPGFGLWANLIYSRAIYGESTPSSFLDNEVLKGDPNLGVELDGGLRFDSGDGFTAEISYGVLFPLAGLDNNIDIASAKTAHTVQGLLGIRF